MLKTFLESWANVFKLIHQIAVIRGQVDSDVDTIQRALYVYLQLMIVGVKDEDITEKLIKNLSRNGVPK